MTFKYVCVRCGNTFAKESNTRLYAQKYCPDCYKVHIREMNNLNRQRYRKEAILKMKENGR